MNDRAAYLHALNPEQRAAAEHRSGPLLVIAGAGTGKTKTLAARVAALIQAGADPATILFLTFTRRAAGEMIRRAGQFVGEAVGRCRLGRNLPRPGPPPAAHLRPTARGWTPASSCSTPATPRTCFTSSAPISDCTTPRSASRRRGRWPPSTHAASTPACRCRTWWRAGYPWCLDALVEIKQIFSEYGVRKGRAQPARLRRPAPLLAGGPRQPGHGRGNWRPLSARAGGRIPGHQPRPGGDPSEAVGPHERRGPGRLLDHGRRRRRPGDLLLPRRHGGEHPPTSPSSSPARPRSRLEQNYRSMPPILDASNAVMSYARQALHQGALVGAARRAEAVAGHLCRRDRTGAIRGRTHPGARRGRSAADPSGGAVPGRPQLGHPGSRAGPPQHSLRQVGRPEVPRGGPRQGPAGLPAHRGEPPRRPELDAGPAIARRRRPRASPQGGAACRRMRARRRRPC